MLAKNRLNLVSSLVLQFVTIISGLIIPRLIIVSFGSEVNGMISSISQFLSFISLFEGGIGAVVLAALYKPIENKDYKTISQILNASSHFFARLATLFFIYTCVLMVLYPRMFAKNWSMIYVSSLILILSATTLMQYMFSITYKLFLQADQKLYLTNIVSSLTVLLNIVISYIIISLYPNIHLVKLVASLIFLIQPVVYGLYVRKNYKINYLERPGENVLGDKRSAFGQNLAHFVNMNTDIIVITIFSGLTNVSIYSVYMLVLNAIRNIISTAANSYQAVFGKYIAEENKIKLRKEFKTYETIFWFASIVVFSTCLLLLNQFVKLYVKDISDAEYYQPIFAIVMTLAQFIYAAREPYRLLVLSAGKFKETNFGAYMEAVINLAVSIALIRKFGLTGIAIGTFCAVFYRMLYLIYFLHSNIIELSYRHFLKLFISAMSIFGIEIYVYLVKPIIISSYFSFIIYGFGFVLVNSIITFILFFLVNQWEKLKHF